MVKKDTVDQTKTTLVQEGCSKSGFTYDTFNDNAGMLTTDSDKKKRCEVWRVPSFCRDKELYQPDQRVYEWRPDKFPY